MSLGKFGINRQQIKQGGGRGTGNDHVDELYGCVEFSSTRRQMSGVRALKD